VSYSEAAIARRRCRGTRKDGQPCRGWALWSDPEQRCLVHAGRAHRGPRPDPPKDWFERWKRDERSRTKAVACKCGAYPFPHRPGSGQCRWPEVTEPAVVPADPAPAAAVEPTPARRRPESHQPEAPRRREYLWESW
jgi:hypothetical protein